MIPDESRVEPVMFETYEEAKSLVNNCSICEKPKLVIEMAAAPSGDGLVYMLGRCDRPGCGFHCPRNHTLQIIDPGHSDWADVVSNNAR